MARPREDAGRVLTPPPTSLHPGASAPVTVGVFRRGKVNMAERNREKAGVSRPSPGAKVPSPRA